MRNVPKYQTDFKVLLHLWQDFRNVYSHSGTLCIKGLSTINALMKRLASVILYFFNQVMVLKKYEKWFLFCLKSSFRS